MDKVSGTSYVKGGGSCINTDKIGYQTRLKQKALLKKKSEEINTLKDRITKLEVVILNLSNEKK